MEGLGATEKRLIFYLSGDLSDSLTPYADLGDKLGWTEPEVLAAIDRFKAQGLLRRVGAMLWHQRSGFAANAMVVFNVPGEQVEGLGVKLASLSYVSHCYQRNTAPGWPFNLYVMIHAEDRPRLLTMVDELVLLTGGDQWRMLESLRELKKVSRRYFSEEHGLESVKNQLTA